MTDQPSRRPLRGHAVEHAAVEWVLEYERSQGREPVDRRDVRAYPGDIESPPRVIEVKATHSDFRGWLLPLEPTQLDHALNDPAFHVYVVENVGQGDPSRFTLRILSGPTLQDLASRAVERRHFEVPWPTTAYDATPVHGAPGPAATDPVVVTRPPGSNAAAAIEQALLSLGGEATLGLIVAEVERKHPGRWRDLTTTIADMSVRGAPSSPGDPDRRVVERVGRGRYRCRV